MKFIIYALISVALLFGQIFFFHGIMIVTFTIGKLAEEYRARRQVLQVCLVLFATIAIFSSAYIAWAQLCLWIFWSQSPLVLAWGWAIATAPHARTSWNADTIPLKLASNLAFLGFLFAPRFGISAFWIWLAAILLASLPTLVPAFREEFRGAANAD